MPDFTKLFMESKAQPIEWKEKTLMMSDKFPVINGDVLLISIEKTNSDYRQGLCVDVTGSCEMDGEVHKIGKGVRMLFWEDTAPKQVELKVITKKEFVRVYNIWEQNNSYLTSDSSGRPVTMESKTVDSGHNGAAMIVEEIENGRRYRCNDWHPDENFDDIVFTIQKVVT